MILGTASTSSWCCRFSTELHHLAFLGCADRRKPSACSPVFDKGGRAFARQLQRTKSTNRHKRCKPVSASNEHDRDDEKEQSRKYRRTVRCHTFVSMLIDLLGAAVLHQQSLITGVYVPKLGRAQKCEAI